MRPRALALTAVTVFVLSCAHTPDANRTSQTTTTGASFSLGDPNDGRARGVFAPSSPELSDPDHPANRLGTAACERKLECDEIGDGKSYATSHACLIKARRHAHEQLDRLSCENGLDPARLTDCIHGVRIAECAAVDQIARVSACTPAQLCAK